MSKGVVVFDISLWTGRQEHTEEKMQQIESQLRKIPGVRDVKRLTAGSSQFGFKFYAVADASKDEEDVNATGEIIRQFFNECIPGVSTFRVSFLQWLPCGTP